ncbi:MAG TPA: hypothetical protein VK324_15950 [Tepidisphaeraceae bacterium]|nr:hypothetical protein [Tepidisphaeraceae bacterium]
MPMPSVRRPCTSAASWAARMTTALVAVALGAGGCNTGPRLVSPENPKFVDRKHVEFPSGYVLQLVAERLTAPTCVAAAPDGSIIVAESGIGTDDGPRILGWRADGSAFEVYPNRGSDPFAFLRSGLKIRGPIGGMAWVGSTLYVTHRDENDLGVVTALDLVARTHRTVVADLPAQGDHALTDVTVHPTTGRLWFGLGTATNSGVVGLDNFAAGWVRDHPKAADQPHADLKLLGYRFNTRNPNAGLFGGEDVAVTAPFQPFGASNQTRVPASTTGKPNGAIFSISPDGGDLKVEASGLRLPRGLAFNEFGRLYATNDGMELRGTRPVQDDPDALLRIVAGTWYGWPDFSADLRPIASLPLGDTARQLLMQSGYPDLAALIDHAATGLVPPNRDALVAAVFPSLSGAAKFDFVPDAGAFREFRGSAVVALGGDRAPFATSGQPLSTLPGYKVVRVDVDARQVREFIRNAKGVPASRSGDADALERPIDVKFAPAGGAMYVLDFGVMEMRDGRPRAHRRTGRLFRLVPAPQQAPSTTQKAVPPPPPPPSQHTGGGIAG